ncbi:uncharacterized protein LOC104443389 [Eucalyptus grandis]|uniref:uncharacterized protein LOC104443389 n=1 Tax=Eucalyptus grandis TaxID=71139 RepID=UPI00192E928F|nr:uncharacterized protein LOC104443389 [Eucalyptus grandis]
MERDQIGESAILELHLISAQNLKPPPANMRRTETYSLVWVDPSTKLRTRLDRVGSDNPTWNDKFFFRVGPDFLSSHTSAVTVEIYAVGYIRDYLVGSVRLLLSTVLSWPDFVGNSKLPYFTAVGIRRPSGKIHGVLNIGIMLANGSDFTALKGASAIGYRDLMGQSAGPQRRGDRRREKKKKKRMSAAAAAAAEHEEVSGGESCENWWPDSAGDVSDGGESTTSSSSTASTVLTVLKDWNGIRELAGKSLRRSSCGGRFLCGLPLQK